MAERFILCKGERLAYQTINAITNKYDAQIFPHLRIKEVASRDWINEEDFDYALKGHIDITIARDFKTLLALELDGKFHQSAKARDRDRRKDQLCDSLQIPLVRLDSGFMRLELLQPILAELVDSWLGQCGTLELSHLHYLNASWMQLEEVANYNRDMLEIPEDAEWHVEVSCVSADGGYHEAFVELVFPDQRIEMGRGRTKAPPNSRVCGRFYAERIAVADAGTYVRTIGGTARDITSEARLPLEGTCERCAVRVPSSRTVDVKPPAGGKQPAAPRTETVVPPRTLPRFIQCRADRPPLT